VSWARTPAGVVLAQTWDMHATAIPYMMRLHVPEAEGRPETWVRTLTGCVGMCGMNHHGVAVAINNLCSTDARIGVVWPALVRRALRETRAAAARDVILSSPVGSGHHYLVADAHHAASIETSGTARKVVFESGADSASFIHTNHCVDADIEKHTRVFPFSSTYDRYRWLQDSVAGRPPASVHDLWMRLGSVEGYPRSVCSNLSTPENPHGTATCGAVAMDIGRRRVWAQAGLIHNVAPQPFPFVETEPAS
jgi:isopenicillin-N N-acyltransferase-like protein